MIGIYIRVSTVEQATEGYSIAAQRERLTAYCQSQGWDDYKFYVDEGISAKNTNRPELEKLFKDIENGLITMILVYRLDRFTRRVVDLHRMLEKMEKYNCAFKSATEPYDTSTATGRMFITLVAALAQWENENLSERIKMALREKVSSGERVGNVPYPFDMNEDYKLVINTRRADITLDMIDKIKSGWSLNRIANYLTKVNNDKPQWTPNMISRIISNPAMYGATRWKDEVFENTHEGIISKNEYDKLQLILKDRSLHFRREVKSTYLFQGIIACSNCGEILRVNRYIRKRSDGSEYQNTLYRCVHCEKKYNGFPSYGEQRILEALYDFMKNTIWETTNQLKVENKKEKTYVDQLNQIEKIRERYHRAWASGFMDDDEFQKLISETNDIYKELKNKVKNQPKPITVDPEEIKNIVVEFNENFKELTIQEKQEFIARFIRKIEFKVITTAPVDRRNKKGKGKIIITNVVFI